MTDKPLEGTYIAAGEGELSIEVETVDTHEEQWNVQARLRADAEMQMRVSAEQQARRMQASGFKVGFAQGLFGAFFK